MCYLSKYIFSLWYFHDFQFSGNARNESYTSSVIVEARKKDIQIVNPCINKWFERDTLCWSHTNDAKTSNNLIFCWLRYLVYSFSLLFDWSSKNSGTHLHNIKSTFPCCHCWLQCPSLVVTWLKDDIWLEAFHNMALL